MIEFNCRDGALLGNFLRHRAEKIPGTGRWLNDAATLETQPLHHAPRCLDDFQCGVVSVWCAGFSRLVLVFAQQCLEAFGAGNPRLFLLVIIERLRNAAPTGVTVEHFSIFRGWLPRLGLQLAQKFDCGNVGLEFSDVAGQTGKRNRIETRPYCFDCCDFGSQRFGKRDDLGFSLRNNLPL
ncbi:MAG: hypothetical protein ACYCTY_08905 [Sulfuricella sp.]